MQFHDMFNISVLFLLGSLLTCLYAQDVTVTTKNGQLRGHTVKTSRNFTFYAFQEIPYGKPPLGKLRFKDPLPAEKWTGVRDATKNTKICYQIGMNPPSGAVESEDCLFVNVYTPLHPSTSNNLPVMIFIHGGAFVNGHSAFQNYGPHYFMENKIVLVTLFYRVGAFGFLSTGDTVIPGNYGLKDQTLAFKWVKENIKSFGGDPTKVTIFGESAGAASVTYHLMSQQSKGLFRAAIAQSGSLLVPWSYQRDHKNVAYYLAQKINGTFDWSYTTKQLLDYFLSLPARKIYDAALLLKQSINDYDGLMQGFEFTPVIETQHPNAFLTENMYEAVEQGRMNRVPLLMGVVSEEQLGRAQVHDDLLKYAKAFDTDPTALLCHDMHLKTDQQKQAAGKAIQQIYGGGFQKDLWKVVKFYSDTAFNRGVYQHAKLQSKYSDVYFYEFSYHGVIGGNKLYLPGAERVQHTEDLSYEWAWWDGLNTYPKSDILTHERFREVLTNFAKYLNPTPGNGKFVKLSWPKVTPNNFQYLSINETLTIRKDYKKTIMDDWVKVYEKYAVKPYDTF